MGQRIPTADGKFHLRMLRRASYRRRLYEPLSHCLWSKHAWMSSGDRAAECGGLMEPVGAEQKSGEIVIIHRCVKCRHIKPNRAAADDDFNLLVELVAQGNIF
ncbi:MAG: RNHCP domain-containing protein [Anaerolineae bacterium]